MGPVSHSLNAQNIILLKCGHFRHKWRWRGGQQVICKADNVSALENLYHEKYSHPQTQSKVDQIFKITRLFS